MEQFVGGGTRSAFRLQCILVVFIQNFQHGREIRPIGFQWLLIHIPPLLTGQDDRTPGVVEHIFQRALNHDVIIKVTVIALLQDGTVQAQRLFMHLLGKFVETVIDLPEVRYLLLRAQEHLIEACLPIFEQLGHFFAGRSIP